MASWLELRNPAHKEITSAPRPGRCNRRENIMANRRSWRSSICRAVHDSTVILVQIRGLAAELVFTVAALYGLFHAFVLLTR
jgi:hypothetical protein